MTGRLAVLTGPSGVGKGTVVHRLVEGHPELCVSVSATTRAPRPGEVEGVTYFFVTDAAFDAMIAAGELLEWAVVHKVARYGTPRTPVEQALAAGQTVLLEVDMDGARQVRQAMPDCETIFLAPPSWEELQRRLRGRGTEDEAALARRFETARAELAAMGEFDHVVVNREVEATVDDLVCLLGLGNDEGRPEIPHS